MTRNRAICILLFAFAEGALRHLTIPKIYHNIMDIKENPRRLIRFDIFGQSPMKRDPLVWTNFWLVLTGRKPNPFLLSRKMNKQLYGKDWTPYCDVKTLKGYRND